MPIHDWTRVNAGTFHNFHQGWVVELSRVLNSGRLPPDYFAMLERNDPDETARESGDRDDFAFGGGVATAMLPPEDEHYARKADRIAIRHGLGNVVAIVEITSPGNKKHSGILKSFTERAARLVHEGVNLLIVDLFPPHIFDPQGVHPLIWDSLGQEETFELPADKPLTLVSYCCGAAVTAYIDPVAVSSSLPDMPLFVTGDRYIQTPLEETYQATWEVMPWQIKRLFEGR